ncbi:MAG: cytochrome c biogenesis protein CcsA [Ignavibacteriales bacterium]|nr:cytochrome c biogenesis protein CcsA [Ignavibacteriales bacterium]MCB9219524.1 cytochrome c biogenesis protein CcsA [Ignavibacteriales bacterium]
MLGNIVITLGFIAGLFTIVMYYLTYKGYENTLVKARIGYHVTAVMSIFASVLLFHAVLTHQYQYNYVFNYSGSGMSTGLLLSTFWGGQEGSFLLWVLFTAIVGIILLEYTSKRGDLEPRVMMVFTLSLTFLLFLVTPLLKSPFNYIWLDPSFIDVKSIDSQFLSLPFIKNFLFEDGAANKTFIKIDSQLYSLLTANGIAIKDFIIEGKGLNPLLQNFWMQIHPPFLFLGFSMSTVPFAFAMAAIIKNDYKDWVKQAFPWMLIGTMVLGFAIMLGGYWAYGILGWGGYWGWDPVENSSLIPWIIGVASIHTLIIQKKTQSSGGAGRFVKTNLILAMLTYIFVLYSTFLTRSGILGDSSVHSFTEPGMLVYLMLVIFIGSFFLIGIFGFIYRWKYLNNEFEAEESLLSRELALFTGAVALIASALIVLAGTSAPIFGQAVEIRFYDELNLPIAIIIGLLNGLSLILKWKSNKGEVIWKNLISPIAISLVLTLVVVFWGGVYEEMLILLAFSSIFTIVVNFEIAYKIARKQPSKLGAYIAHIGIALFLLGVVATGGHSDQDSVDLEKGKATSVFGYDLTFLGYKPIENGKKYAFEIKVEKGNSSSVIAPVMYVAAFNNSLMREPAIWNMFTKDFYITPLSFEDGSSQSQHTGTHVTIKKGDSFDYMGNKITFDSFNFPADAMSAMMGGGDFTIGANITVESANKSFKIEPQMKSAAGNREFVSQKIDEIDLLVEMTNLDASGSVNLNLSSINGGGDQPAQMKSEILSIEASIKPFIGLVWTGVILMVVGFIISAVRRTKET